ncbi:hypothetical protein [Serratia quinivorans]|uniref:hypothetical protein n=1 Tax=Serratia quinivorans TaxID=137545 RepID=UPI00398200D7
MQREDFDVYYAQQTYLKQRIAARSLDCSKPKKTQMVAPPEELSPRQEERSAPVGRARQHGCLNRL